MAKSVYVSAKPQGAYKDEILIKANTINGKPFKGTFTCDEVRLDIFVGILGYDKNLLHGYKTEWRNGQTLFLKLKEQVNVDDLWEVENFTYTRKIPRGDSFVEDKIECNILGIRRRPGQGGGDYEPLLDSIRWVKVEGADYRIQKNEMLDWLSIWGEPLSDMKEEMHEASIDPDTDSEPLGTGEYSVKMDFNILPPQHIPMCGRRIRIYYKGIAKKCGKCFGDHRPTECDQERVPWINYIRDFREDYPEVKDEMYGRWLRILNEEQAAGNWHRHRESGPVLPLTAQLSTPRIF
jgi:hypothetical protein